jgi:hypothetical protein
VRVAFSPAKREPVASRARRRDFMRGRALWEVSGLI